AIAVLESGTKIDLVFSDIVMAGEMDGYDLARLVTARWPAIRVVLTSGFPETLADQEPDFTRSFRLLSKPYSNQDLARALREALDAPVMVAVNAAADVTA
ncbi:MAG TPA: hypothetical protein VMB81_09200, partial [Candidatus Sulfotelmatobacter sp.]|nr:hypothetical protein [Candidatus Sulfotelmatobacter sp.]